jgi:isopentenyl-diphosphate delta-isomerase type 1
MMSCTRPTEVFDVVDEHDMVIGQAPRAQVPAQHLRHRAVHIVLFNSQGEVFLQKRSALKDLHPNTWDSSCSGHVDSGEDYDTAARRELGEELGLRPSPPLELLGKIEARAETGEEFVHVYRGHHDGPFVLQLEEISEGRFFTPAEISAWIAREPEVFAPAFCYLWGRFFQALR